MKKVIGITTAFENNFTKLNRMYYEAVIKAGAIPISLCCSNSYSTEVLLKNLDGVILSGGGDIHFDYIKDECLHPLADSIYPERDEFEINICKYALSNDLPVLGICRGMQILSVACGGNIVQHIEADNHNQKNLERNKTFHSVYIEDDCRLKEIYNKEKISVNSFHHQAVSDAGVDMRVCARSHDGVIEAVEHMRHSFFVGVQWHPECLFLDFPVHFNLFKRFVMV